MTTTTKEYNNKVAERSNLKSVLQDAKNNEDWSMAHVIQISLDQLEAEYFDQLDTVSVSYSIGGRSYYEDVVKIGKSYYCHGRKMTKGRGYWFIEEIAEITEQMSHDMMADSYYY